MFPKSDSHCLQTAEVQHRDRCSDTPACDGRAPVGRDPHKILFYFHSISLKLMKSRLRRVWISCRILSSITMHSASKWNLTVIIISPSKAPVTFLVSSLSPSFGSSFGRYSSDVRTFHGQMRHSMVFLSISYSSKCTSCWNLLSYLHELMSSLTA